MNRAANIQAMVAAVTEAGFICRRIQQQLVTQDTLTKADRSPVTIADFASQAVVCRVLRQHFPETSIVAEETAADLRTGDGKAMVTRIVEFMPEWTADAVVDAIAHGGGEPASRFFTLDPIDGTKGFLRGDNYAVALALIDDGQLSTGALCCPNVQAPGNAYTGVVCFTDENGQAWRQPMRGGAPELMSVQTGSLDQQVRFLESVESGHANHGTQGKIMAAFGDRARSVRVDSQAKYAMLAMGAADVYLRLPKPGKARYLEKIWDHAAGAHLVSCAGGTVTDMTGVPLDFGSGRHLDNNRGVIATCGPLHDEVVALVGKFLDLG